MTFTGRTSRVANSSTSRVRAAGAGPRRALTVCAAVLLGIAALAQSPAPEAPPVMITGARILDAGAGRYLPPAAVLIEHGRITSITAEPPRDLPESVTPLKLDGATLVPGLVDAHASAAPASDLDADYFYLLGLAHGVTAYRVINVRTAWGVSQRGRARSGSILAPQLWTSGRGIDQAASPGRWFFDAPDGPVAAEETARQVAAKVDWIAGYDNVAPDVYKALVDAVKGSPVRVSGLPGASSMLDLANAGVRSVETLAYPTQPRKAGGADEAWLSTPAKDLTALNTRLVRGQVILVPMMAAALARAYPEDIAADESLALLPEARRTALTIQFGKLPKADVARARLAWTSRGVFIQRFVRAGGRVVTGTGFEFNGYPVPGAGIHREIAALVKAGLTPADAIRAATLNGAQLLGAAADDGRLKPGAEANLFAVKGDPLKNVIDLARITTVIRAGEVLDPKDLLARAKSAVLPARPTKGQP